MTKTQLFMLHFAGGSCYSYLPMNQYFNANVQVIPIELPGRGKRLAEPLLSDFETALEDCYRQIKNLRQQTLPFILYGHSMGALMALMLTDKLEKNGDFPLKLVASGNAGPNAGSQKQRHLLNDTELKVELKNMGGASDEILEHKELFDFFNPIIRADFKLLETKSNWPKTNVKCPVSVVMGTLEPYVNEIRNWDNFCALPVEYQTIDGHHFFINDVPKEMAHFIQRTND